MARGREAERDEETDALIEEILVDAYGDDEQLWAFRQAIEDVVSLPADAFVIGEPVSVVGIDYDGNSRRGLAVRCRREDGTEYVVAAADVVFPEGSIPEQYIAAYRKWLGLDPLRLRVAPPPGRVRRHKVAEEDLDLGIPVELVALAVREQTARCRVLGSEREITLRSAGVWDVVPGEIVTVEAKKQWRFSGHPYLSGEIAGRRLEVGALGLVPLRLEDRGMWDPAEQHWGEPDEPLEAWARPIAAGGARPAYEMEQVIPGEDPGDPFDDPILTAVRLQEAGDPDGARKVLMNMLIADLRCLDAHAHLGNLSYRRQAEEAVRHYEAGLRIGELSLGEGFDGVLSWGHVDNRPFSRCLHGYGLCLWRLERDEEALAVFERMLRQNPTDNLGARFLLADVRAGWRWEDRHGKD